MEGVAAVARVVAPLVLVTLLAGCVSSPEAPPPAGPELNTRLTAPTTAGSAEVGSFLAVPGDLWIGGRCSGGDLEVHVDPVVVLPIPCRALAGEPFLNQVVMTRPTTVTVLVTAPETVTWELEVQQK